MSDSMNMVSVDCADLSEPEQRRLLQAMSFPNCIETRVTYHTEEDGKVRHQSCYTRVGNVTAHPAGDHSVCVHYGPRSFICSLTDDDTTNPKLVSVAMTEDAYERYLNGQNETVEESSESYELPTERGFYKGRDNSVFYTRDGREFQLVMNSQGIFCDPAKWVVRREMDTTSRTMRRFPFTRVYPQFMEVH